MGVAVRGIETVWDDLMEGVGTRGDWERKRGEIRGRFLELLRDEAKPAWGGDLKFEVEKEWRDGEGFTISRVSYQVEADERAYGYLAVPAGAATGALADATGSVLPSDKALADAAGSVKFPAVLCLHGTLNWGARNILGLGPEAGDPHGERKIMGGDFARLLVRAGFVVLCPEHFCCATRMPKEGPYETGAFYRKHPGWSAIGKSTYENKVALDVLAGLPMVDKERMGATGHSLGGHNSVFIGAYDERVKCVVESCGGSTLRENAEALQWSRDHWYVYIPQIREQLLRGERVGCDFHEMMALVSPRAFMDMFALNDGDPGTQGHRVMLHLKLREVYRLLGAEERHAYLVMGDGHAWTDLSRGAMVGWMKRWLVNGGRAV